MTNKPLIYVDTDLAINCLMRSLCTAGFCTEAEKLLGLTVSDPASARHAQRIVMNLPKIATTEKARRGALEMLTFAERPTSSAAPIQVPIDLC